MILSCPNCATRFFVEDTTFGSARRKVRCSRCRHVWQQDPLPEDWEPPPPPGSPEPAPERPEPPMAESAPKPEPPRSEPPKAPPPPPPPPPQASMVDEMPPPPRITGFDEEDDLLLEDDRPPLHPPLDEPPSADDDDPDAVLARRRERLAQAGMQRPPSQPKRKRSFAWVGWLLLIALIGGVIGGGYEKRAELIAFYPPLAKLYEQLGIPVDAAEWLGLELHNLKSATVLDGGQTKIAITGEVVNVGGTERALPSLRVAMRGASGQELAAYTLALEQPRIGADETLSFDLKLPAPREDVTDLEVAFAAQPGS